MSRICLVTGANRGIGLEFVRQLLARGDRVIATARHPGHATGLTALGGEHPGRLQVAPLDVADARSRDALVAELPLLLGEGGRLGLVINNAGVLHSGERFGALREETLLDSLKVNAIGPFLLTQALAPWLQDWQLEAGPRDSGANVAVIGNATFGSTPGAPRAAADPPAVPIVANISSQLGSIAGVRRFGAPSYAASKAAQNMLTAQLAQALAPRGIVVLALHPGWVQTAMGGDKATDAPADVVAGMLRVIDGAGLQRSGAFLDWHGEALRW